METFPNSQDNIGMSMRPFVMRELVAMVIRKKAIPLNDALYYIYSSKLYKSLTDESTKLWYSSTLSLYESLEKEKSAQRKCSNEKPEILLFKMFCIENYTEATKKSAEETLLLFSRHHVFDFLAENFEMLHTQDRDYIIDTITTYLKKKK